jgi:hypothetical protein
MSETLEMIRQAFGEENINSTRKSKLTEAEKGRDK